MVRWPGSGNGAKTSNDRSKRGTWIITAIVLAAVLGCVVLLADILTEAMWYQQLSFDGVYWRRLASQALAFGGAFVLMAGLVGLSGWLAHRSRPHHFSLSTQSDPLQRYRDSLARTGRLMSLAILGGLGLLAGTAMAANWDTWLMWLHAQPFGKTDPQFGKDIGFYVFTLPALQLLVGFVTTVLSLSLVAAIVIHYLYGGLRLHGRGRRTTAAARVHISVLLGLILLAQTGSYWLDRYSELVTSQGLFDGAGYTSVNATIPGRSVMAGIALVVALWFFASAALGAKRGAKEGTWRLPVVGVGLMVVCALLVNGLAAVVQRFQVDPSQVVKEAPYLQRNIDATREAFGIDKVQVITDYTGDGTTQSGALSKDATTAASIRLLDPAVVSPAFRQLERNKQYYGFADPLDVDRYKIDGKIQDAVVAAREMNQAGLSEGRSWFNDHAVYTHGFGMVAAYGAQREASGQPKFFQKGIPSVGALGKYEPRIYFGENSPNFSIVGAPEGAAPTELDYPDSGHGNESQAKNTYQGDGGPRVGAWWKRLLFAIKFRDQNIVLSDAVNPESQILYDREPRRRVQKVAPFLTIDGDPFPSVVDGRIQWIVDGYTVSSHYPYSQRQPLGEVTIDSRTARSGSVVALQPQKVNYLRNSVKATVDAYTGEVKLFAWDDQDPVLKTWTSIFPNVVRPMSEMSGALMSHVRYPEDMFKVQRKVLSLYHVTNASQFNSGDDAWMVPKDPIMDQPADGAGSEARKSAVAQPPYYLTLRMPGQKESSFSLTTTYVPDAQRGQDTSVLKGFMAVDSNAGDVAGQRAPGYGTFRLVKLPQGKLVSGPGAAQNKFNSDPQVASQLNTIRVGGTTNLKRGNLLTLPVAEGFLYVQPLYVESKSDSSMPLLKKVLVMFGDQLGFADTLDEALNQVFKGNSGAAAGDKGTTAPGGSSPGVVNPGGGQGAAPVGDANAQMRQALQDANKAITDGKAALAQGNFEAYGKAQAALAEAVGRASAIQDSMMQNAKPAAPGTP